MVKEDDLSILFTLDLSACADSVLLCRVQVWVHIDNLSVTTVSEEETGVGVSIDLEVWGVSVLNLLTFP